MPDAAARRRPPPPTADQKMEKAMDKLVEKAAASASKDKAAGREGLPRLIQLDEFHYFDTQDKVLLLKDGAQYRNVNCNPVYLKRSQERIREDAKKTGAMPIEGGSFWNAKTKHLYIINGERYVLYAMDRRKSTRNRRAGEG